MKVFSKDKTGKLDGKVLNTILLFIVLVVVAFQVYAELIPEAQDAGDQFNKSQICEAAGSCYYNSTDDYCQVNTTNSTACTTGYDFVPLGGLFQSTGLVYIVIMAALLIIVVKKALKGK